MQQTAPHTPEEIQQAINEIYLWVKDGCPEHETLKKHYGLCWNISGLSCSLYEEIPVLFWKGKKYPFNHGSEDQFFDEQNKFTNPKRLAWLQEHQTVE